LVSDGQQNFWSVWVGLRSGRSRLYLSRSTDGGHTWANPLELSGESQSVFGQHILRSGERVLVVWQDKRTGRERLFAVSSSDGGATWTPPTRIDHLPDDLPTDAFGSMAVMSPAGEVFVIWSDGRHGRDDIFFGRSADGGRTWDNKDIRVDADEAGTAVSRFPSIARGGDGRIAVVWDDDRAGYEGVYLRVRSSGPQPAWGPEIPVAPPGPKKAMKQPVALWAADGSLQVAWEVLNYAAGPLAITKRIDGRTLVPDRK
jgi:Neuraminidase (sialidase)